MDERLSLFLGLLIVTFQLAGGLDASAQDKPSLRQMAMDTIASLKRSHQSSWDKIKSVIRNAQLQFFPPDLDFRGAGDGGNSKAVGNVKEAAEKTVDIGKRTAEETAKSAASAVGDAVHKTKEKVKNKMSHPEL